MFHVLVVEDEGPILRNVCKMIEVVNPLFRVQHRARNGKEALDILENNENIDLMILDISMPIMNGMELMGILTERNIQTKIVVLSGFHDFEYLRTAMRSGAIDYLTKPLKKEELQRVLTRVEEILVVENYQKNTQVHNQKEDKEFDGNYEMASVIFGGTITVEEATNIYQIVEAEEILKAYLEEKYEPDEYWIINRTYNELIIMFKKNNVKNQMLWRNMKEIFREARITVTMALYQYPQSHKTIHITDNKLKSIVRDLMNIKNHVFYYGDGYDIAEQNYEEIRRVKEKYVYAQHKNQVGDGLQKLIAHSSGNRSVLLELLKTYVLYYFEKFGIEYSYTEIESRIRYCVMSVASLEELGEEVRRLCSEYFMTKEEKSQSKYHIAQEMKQYIDTNYADNITNLVLEQKYGFVSSYLRQIFQQEHKISPMEYLQKVRIEQSKLLINNSKGKSFKAVALAVGFNDSMYFSKVFRKMVGMTPSEYKDSLNGNSFE